VHVRVGRVIRLWQAEVERMGVPVGIYAHGKAATSAQGSVLEEKDCIRGC